MRFLERERFYDGYYRRRSYDYLHQILVRFAIVWTIAYLLTCIFLFFRQDYIIYHSSQQIGVASVSVGNFQLDYQDVWIDVPNSKARIHGWWFDAPSKEHPVIALPDEPVNVLTTPKTILYLCGKSNKKYYYNLTRIQGFQQLGFSVLGIDYRGYGLSEGRSPNESRLYEDGRVTWEYLTKQRQISPQDIIIYGESLGGAVAIDLAVKQNNAAGLIVQSSFTSMVEQIRQLRPGLSIFPLRLIVHQRFNSLEKVKSLEIPVLFLHGTADTVVDYKMSRQLYYAAPEPKTLFFVPDGEHRRLYQPGKHSYLLAIADFVNGLEETN